MWRGVILAAGVLLGISGAARAQAPATPLPSNSSKPFEILDNSFFVEAAFNQEYLALFVNWEGSVFRRVVKRPQLWLGLDRTHATNSSSAAIGVGRTITRFSLCSTSLPRPC
jgi:hypothetical protein